MYNYLFINGYAVYYIKKNGLLVCLSESKRKYVY